MMRRQENAPKLVVVFEDGQPVEVTTGVPLAGFNPKYTVETYVPTPEHESALESARREAFEEAAKEAESWWEIFAFDTFSSTDLRRVANPNQIAASIRQRAKAAPRAEPSTPSSRGEKP